MHFGAALEQRLDEQQVASTRGRTVGEADVRCLDARVERTRDGILQRRGKTRWRAARRVEHVAGERRDARNLQRCTHRGRNRNARAEQANLPAHARDVADARSCRGDRRTVVRRRGLIVAKQECRLAERRFAPMRRNCRVDERNRTHVLRNGAARFLRGADQSQHRRGIDAGERIARNVPGLAITRNRLAGRLVASRTVRKTRPAILRDPARKRQRVDAQLAIDAFVQHAGDQPLRLAEGADPRRRERGDVAQLGAGIAARDRLAQDFARERRMAERQRRPRKAEGVRERATRRIGFGGLPGFEDLAQARGRHALARCKRKWRE